MKLNTKKKQIIFIILYTIITIVLILNAFSSKLLIDILYTLLFLGIYLKYLYRSIYN